MIKKKSSIKYYHLRVFGCQMNKSDGERIDGVMEKWGYSPTLDEEKADVIIAVACSVRQSAVDRIYGLTGRWEKLKIKNPRLKSILTGCVLEFDRRKLAGRFDAIIPITKIGEILKVISHESLGMRDTNKCGYLKIEPKRKLKFQAWVPIMTGCDNFCSYCVVPYVRGREKSRPAEEIVDEVRGLVLLGYKEITLLGENVNRYRSKSKIKNKISKTKIKNEKIIDFPQLLLKLTKIPGKFWLRFVTSHPEDFTDELIGVIASELKICNYIHLPLQSGSSAVLKKMNRKYTKDKYVRLVKKIRKTMPDVALSTDIIVGFPSETKEQFEETAEVMRKLKFDMAYIAQYSPRLGTTAAKLKDNVLKSEKKRREGVLTKILEETALENNQGLVGKMMTVLVESEVNKVNKSVNNFLVGKTGGFKKVRFEGDGDLVGEFVKVRITRAGAWGLEGALATKSQKPQKI